MFRGLFQARMALAPLVLAGAAVSVPVRAAYQAATTREQCEVGATISVEAVCSGSLFVCTRSSSPLACAVAAACQSSAAKGVAKAGVAEGCTYVVETADDVVTFFIRSKEEKAQKAMEQAKEVLEEVDEIRWNEP